MNRRCLLFFLFTLISSLLVMGCHSKQERANGVATTSNNRAVKTFVDIRIRGRYNVNIAYGKHQSLTVIAPPNLQALIKTSVSGGELYIHTKRGYKLTSPMPLVINIVTPRINRMRLSDTSQVMIKNVVFINEAQLKNNSRLVLMTPNKLRQIDVANSAVLIADGLEAQSLDIHGIDKGLAIVGGHVATLRVHAKNAFKIEGDNLIANRLDVNLKNHSQMIITVKNKLLLRLYGNAQLFYLGHPVITESVIRNKASVKKID